MSTFSTHKNPTGVPPIVFDYMIQDHNLGAKVHCRNPKLSKSHENVGLGILAEMTNDSVTGVVGIPSDIFFPGFMKSL